MHPPRLNLLALAGLALTVFGLVSSAGPGRIDVVDGQTRFEVGRSLHDHGDSALRDARVTWSAFPGRGGATFAHYRLPQSVVAAVAISIADLFGPAQEGRRHFVYVLGGAVAAAALAVAYAVGFAADGMTPRLAVGWALAGIVATPSFFFATSTFDEIYGTAVVVIGLTAARSGRPSILLAVIVGLLFGVAYQLKPPLGGFALPAMIALARRSSRPRWAAALVLAGLAVGVVTDWLYERWKFPPETRVAHAPLLARYLRPWPGDLTAGLVCHAISPGAGALWHCPPLLLSLAGIMPALRREGWYAGSLLAVAMGYTVLVSSMSFFKGDPTWGPRYLTPVFAVLFLFAPWGAARFGWHTVAVVLLLGVVVQCLGLAVDPHRLYVENGMPSSAGAQAPGIYFVPKMAGLWRRPAEIAAILADGGRAAEFTPAPSPTFAFPVVDELYQAAGDGPEVVQRYQVLRTWRPWWHAMRWLPSEERPVPLATTALALLAITLLGAIFLRRGIGSSEPRASATGSGTDPVADARGSDGQNREAPA